MSLDVYLIMEGSTSPSQEDRIFIREDGQTIEISRVEWDARFPGREPVTVRGGEEESQEVFWANITHNLGKMAAEAGIYECCWRPDELGIERARDLIGPLRDGLTKLRGDPGRYKAFDSPHGWGLYDNFVPWVERYLEACISHPDASVRVSR